MGDWTHDRVLRDKRVRLDRFLDYIPIASFLKNCVNAIQLRRFKDRPDVSLYQQYLRHKTIKICVLYMLPLAKIIHKIWKRIRGIKNEKLVVLAESVNSPTQSRHVTFAPTPPFCSSSKNAVSASSHNAVSASTQNDAVIQPEQQLNPNAWNTYNNYSRWESFQPFLGLQPGQRPISYLSRPLVVPPAVLTSGYNPSLAPLLTESSSSDASEAATPIRELFEGTSIEATVKSIRKTIKYAQTKWELLTQFHEVLSVFHTSLQSPVTFYQNFQDPSVEANQGFFDMLKNTVGEFEQGYDACVALIPQLESSVNNSLTLSEVEAEKERVDTIANSVSHQFHKIEGVNAGLVMGFDSLMTNWRCNVQSQALEYMGMFFLLYTATSAERAAVKYKS